LPDDVAQHPGGRADQVDPEAVTDSGLGLQVADLSDEMIDRLELPANTEGVVVVNIDPNGVAREAGLRRGTVIFELNGKPVKSVEDYEGAAEDVDVEKGVTMSVKIPGVGARFLILKRR
jgi:serine protease Do